MKREAADECLWALLLELGWVAEHPALLQGPGLLRAFWR